MSNQFNIKFIILLSSVFWGGGGGGGNPRAPPPLYETLHYLAPTHCIEMSEIEAAVYLIKIGAFPENREWDLTASTTERPTTEDDFGLLVWKSSRSLIHSTNSFTKCSLSTPISGAPGFSRRPTPLPILVLSFLSQKVTVD